MDLTFSNKLLKLNHEHYAKLRTLFLRHSGLHTSPSTETLSDEVERQFHASLFVLLARYHGIQGHGYQAACGEKVFEAFAHHFGVKMECFGSPLNSFFSRFCSAFPDTDWCFGAVDNFFHFLPPSGHFEVNPPFIPAVMLAAVEHISLLLERAESQRNSLGFVIVLPGWLDDPAILLLEASIWKRVKYSISKEEHGFCDGAQHQRMDRFRESPFDTFIYVLQTSQGMESYPSTPEAELDIRKAMALAVPSEAARLRRQKAGRGFGDADGAGGVYKGKRRQHKDTEMKEPPNKRTKK